MPGHDARPGNFATCVTSRKTDEDDDDDDDDASAAHARDARVEVLILTQHRAVFFSLFPPSSPRPPAVLARATFLPGSRVARWLNKAIATISRTPREGENKIKGSPARLFTRNSRERRDTRAATRNYGRDVASALYYY